MESLKLNHKFRDIHQLRENIKRPHCNQITINLSENAHKKIDCTKKYYSKITLFNNLPKNPDRLTELLRYYSKNLRLCSNLRELYIQQIVLTDQNLKYLTRLIKFLKHLQVLSLDIRLSDVLSLLVVNKFYRAIYRLKQISGLKIFTSTFYRYPHNILKPLFLRPDLQSRLRHAEFTITRELSENQKETFLARLQKFKRIQDLSLDFSRASTANTLPYILGGFDAFKHLESLSMNLNGQYMPTDAYKNLALSLESLNLQKLTMTFKCTSTIGYDLYKVLKAVNRKLNYLKLTFIDEHNLSSDALAPLEDAFKLLGRLNEFYLDVSQSQFCNLILNKIAFAFSKMSSMKKIFIKYNSNDAGFKYRGVAMQNIREILKGNPYLKDIELHCMDSRGVKDHIMPLIEGVKALKSLEYLNLYFHYIPMGDLSFKGLIQAIEDNKKNLKGLNLKIDSYRLTDHSLEILAASLKKLQCLEEFTLTIMKWKISEKGLRPLSSVLMNLRKLFRIEVKFIEAGSEKIAQDFELGLKKGLSKHRLCVEYCK